MPSPSQLKDSLAALPLAALLSDGNGVVKYVSPALCALLGAEPGLKGDVRAEHAAFLGPELQERVRTAATRRAGRLLHFRHDGRMLTVFTSAAGLDEDGTALFLHVVSDAAPCALAGVAEEDADRREATLRALVEQAQREAADARRTQNTFLTNVSHEIRTPLNGIIGIASLLRESGLNREQQWYLDMVTRSSEALLSLVNNLLDLSAIESGMVTPQLGQFNPHTDLHQWVSAQAVQAYAKGLECALYVDPALPAQLQTDPRRLRQVLSNLLDNAIKFTEHGHVMVSCEAESPPGAGTCTVRLSVTDTGRGIAADRRDRIFARFVQEDETVGKRFGGAGIGLAICRELVAIMGGRVSVESAPGIGSTFHVVLPCTVAADARPPECRPHDANASVLIVSERTSVNATVAARYLAHCRVTFKHVHNTLALGTIGRRYGAVVLQQAVVRHNVATFVNDLRRIVGDKVFVVFAPPLELFGCRNDPRYDGVQVIAEPFSLSELQAAIAATARDPAPGAEPPGHAGRAEAGAAPPAGVRIRVLVAEDNEVNQIYMTRMLHKMNCEVLVAANGYQACAQAYSQPFDIIIMDVQMPGMDGLEAARRIRAHEAKRGLHVPIVALTAGATPKDQEACLGAGMDGYLSKPVTPEQLHRAIEDQLPRSRPAPAPSSAAPAAAGSRYEEALRALGGDRELFGELAAILLAKWPELIKEVERCYETQDWQGLARVLHTIKGSVSVFGSSRFGERMGGLVAAARCGTPGPREECLRLVTEECAAHRRLKEANDAAMAEATPPASP